MDIRNNDIDVVSEEADTSMESNDSSFEVRCKTIISHQYKFDKLHSTDKLCVLLPPECFDDFKLFEKVCGGNACFII